MHGNANEAPNPYSPPSSDVDSVVWPTQTDAALQPTADRGSRLGAFLLDALVYLAALIPAFVMTLLLRPSAQAGLITLFLVIALGLLPMLAYQWYLTATTGQTLGKKWLRIRIVKLDGTPAGFLSAVLVRVWLPWLLLQALGFAIGFLGGEDHLSWVFTLIDLLWIFGGPNRCVHDLLAGTKVVVA